METRNVVLTFEFVNEILQSDHSNETSLAVLLHGTFRFLRFSKMKFGIFLELFLMFGTLGSKRVKDSQMKGIAMILVL